jgi:hypothetical protein
VDACLWKSAEMLVEPLQHFFDASLGPSKKFEITLSVIEGEERGVAKCCEQSAVSSLKTK